MRWFLAVLRSFFHSSLSYTFSCHSSLPTMLPSSLTSSCHLFLGLPLGLVVSKSIAWKIVGCVYDIMFPHTVTHWGNSSLFLEVDSQFFVGTICTALYFFYVFIKFPELFVCFNYYSGLESASAGTHYQAVGPQTQYQQCQKYDNFKLLIGAHGYSFLTVWVLML